MRSFPGAVVFFQITAVVHKGYCCRSMSIIHNDNNNKDAMTKPRILCLHGRCQYGAMLSNKIAGARKKLQRVYELDFLDGPLEVMAAAAAARTPSVDTTATSSDEPLPSVDVPKQLAWWERNLQTGQHINVEHAFTYVTETVKGEDYDAIIGFSQGGVLGASLVLTGAFPNVKAIVTAGSPFVPDAFDCARSLAPNPETIQHGLDIPKLHFAGTTDAMVPVESTQKLCETAGNGEVILHEKGHLFPTKAAYVNQMIQFLEEALKDVKQHSS